MFTKGNEIIQTSQYNKKINPVRHLTKPLNYYFKVLNKKQKDYCFT